MDCRVTQSSTPHKNTAIGFIGEYLVNSYLAPTLTVASSKTFPVQSLYYVDVHISCKRSFFHFVNFRLYYIGNG